jgi:hypothetical protein
MRTHPSKIQSKWKHKETQPKEKTKTNNKKIRKISQCKKGSWHLRFWWVKSLCSFLLLQWAYCSPGVYGAMVDALARVIHSSWMNFKSQVTVLKVQFTICLRVPPCKLFWNSVRHSVKEAFFFFSFFFWALLRTWVSNQ